MSERSTRIGRHCANGYGRLTLLGSFRKKCCFLLSEVVLMETQDRNGSGSCLCSLFGILYAIGAALGKGVATNDNSDAVTLTLSLPKDGSQPASQASCALSDAVSAFMHGGYCAFRRRDRAQRAPRSYQGVPSSVSCASPFPAAASSSFAASSALTPSTSATRPAKLSSPPACRMRAKSPTHSPCCADP